MRVAQRIKISVAQSKDEVFLRREFARFGSVAQVTRALGQLITEGQLVRLGVGVYAKAKRSVLSGKAIPVRPLEMLAPLALKKLGVWAGPGRAARDYNEGRTTQLPAGVVIDTGSRRISRRIGFGGSFVEYESHQARARDD